MDDPLDEKLDNLTKMVEEDHKMIRSIYRSNRLASVLRLVYWIILIGTAVGAYYFLEPYVRDVTEVYQSIKSTKANFDSNGWFNSFREAFNGTTTPR